jgi:hypothetical protein
MSYSLIYFKIGRIIVDDPIVRHQVQVARALTPRIFHGTFPNNQSSPIQSMQLIHTLAIPFNISRQFITPKNGIRCGEMKGIASVCVPKAAVNKHNRSVLRQYQVGPSRQCRPIEPKTKTQTMQPLPNCQFRSRVLPSNSSHHAASHSHINNVIHGLICQLLAGPH